MGRTKINVSSIINSTNQISSAKTSVSSAKSSFIQTKNNIDGKIQNRSNIRSRLSTVQRQLSNIDSKIGRIRSTVQSGAQRYQQVDSDVNNMNRKRNEEILRGALKTVHTQFSDMFHDVSNHVDKVREDFKRRVEEERKNSDPLPSLRNYRLIDEFIASRSPKLDAITFGLSRSDLLEGIKSLYNSAIGRDDMIDKVYKNHIESIIFAIEPEDKFVDIGKELLSEYDSKVVGSVEYWNEIVETVANGGEDYKYLQYMDKETFKNLGGLLKYGQEGVESLEILLTDYSTIISRMHNIKNGLEATGGNSEIIGYLDELTNEYNNKLNGILNNVIDFAADESFNVGFSSVSTLTTGGLLDVANGAHKLIWKVGGIEGKGDTLAALYASNAYSNDVVSAYDHYAETLRSGNYTPNDVVMCETLFEYAKEMKIQEYNGIREFSDSDMYDFIDSEIESLQYAHMSFGKQ